MMSAKPSSCLAVLFTVWVTLVSFVSADLALGDTLSTYDALTDKISLTWKDDGTSPPLDNFKTIKVLLCTGPNSNIDCFVTLAGPTNLNTLTGDTLSVPLTSAATLGNDGSYYLQVVALVSNSQFSIHYSDRFQLTGMSGTTVQASTGGDTSPPPAAPAAGNGAGAPADPGAAASLAKTPYESQTGTAWITRYAPMQLQPGTSVTAKLTPSPRFPTSAVTYFVTARPSPSVHSTITMGWSYVFSSLTNYATPMPTPTLYYQASQVIASSIEAVSRSKAKRWMD
ncbi:Kre9p [Sugiyamaella lignohabitans]|uniref:Kre9p n=1 Tax=Sugiyamaella lignohabitans TaxID=796027 RepID=A0A167DBN8_9ASCO|nr:Kre9p [Sugiyamaella lignohabitans]ANB12723.1 Kre9p [Sugiyamaella lignohabitans]